MELVKVRVEGFRRFRESSPMKVDSKLIAIMGPNEAGKSSFLQALYKLNDNEPIIASGPGVEVSRTGTYDDNDVVIEATFLLEPHDNEAISHLPGGKDVRWFVAKKKVGGSFIVSSIPEPRRPENWREQIASRLKKITPKIKKDLVTNPVDTNVLEAVVSVVESLEVNKGILQEPVLGQMNELVEFFDETDVGDRISPLEAVVQELRELISEQNESLALNISRKLHSLRPKFRLFGPAEIDLRSEYDLSSIENDIPVALANLARLANLDLGLLVRFSKEGDRGQVATLEEKANEVLKVFFDAFWSQSSSLTVRLSAETNILHILVGEDATPYVRIAERSDGLRRYVALISFLQLDDLENRPILLIDEAETHLHYDAQADLVQMLARQELASKVIYTTHSIGCLPEDLGTGVRMIDRGDSDSSTIENSFWESDEPGFSPLLFGMGAQTLAFIPVRRAVIAEGAADMILLPSLLREASASSHLGFQVVPGLSNANEAALIQLENSSPSTAYLTDADQAGKELRRRLIHAGIDSARILSYPHTGSQEAVLEDFVNKKLYVSAVNKEFFKSYGDKFAISVAEFPGFNAPSMLNKWCKKKGINAPSKRAVAYRILELRDGKSLINGRRRAGLLKLLKNIRIALKME